MNKKVIILCLALALTIIGIWLVLFNRPKSSLSSPVSSVQTKQVQPSETLKEYSDPAGFIFRYPDNLSISSREVDNNTYADLQLSSKDVNGSLNLKITDSKFKALDEWVKLNKDASLGEPKDVKLGSLKAIEIKTADRLLLGALDEGIFFSIEIPLVEENFWMMVHDKVLADFSFTAPQANTDTSSNDISFEGEEVVQ